MRHKVPGKIEAPRAPTFTFLTAGTGRVSVFRKKGYGHKKLKEKLERAEDPRRPWGNIRCKPEDIPVIGLPTLIRDGEDFQDMEAFGARREAGLKKFLELPHGTPDESAFIRVFTRIKTEQLPQGLYEWLAEARKWNGTAAKYRRENDTGSGKGDGNPLHAVSAWAGEEKIIPGQAAADEKSNGIKIIPKLPELLDITGAVVTIDAMGCRWEIAAKVREQEADYFLAVKDNQPAPHEGIRVTGVGKGHVWIEKREGPQRIIQYRCHRKEHGETAVTDRYSISSSAVGADEFYRYLRGHWPIENKPPWSLDVLFREDGARVTKGHAPEDLNNMRKTALSLLRAAPLALNPITRMSGPQTRIRRRPGPHVYVYGPVWKVNAGALSRALPVIRFFAIISVCP
jgi:predicted transposase YbfD/YdcC